MGLLDNIRNTFTRKPPPPSGDNIRMANFGFIDIGGQRHAVNFADDAFQPGSITPEEAERLKTNNRGTPSLTLDLQDFIEEGKDVHVEKEDDEWMYEYWRMRKDDTVRDALNYILSILHTTEYFIEPASEEENDLTTAAFIADSLGLDGKRAGKYPWERLLKIYEHALLYQRSAGELVFQPTSGQEVILDKIVPIHPFNIIDVQRDSRGGPRALQVEGTTLGEDAKAVEVNIPMWKLIMFVNDDEGDLRGASILESAWLAWKVKRAMIQLINAGFERFLLGIPVLKAPKGITKGSKDWEDARQTLIRFAMKPRTGMLLPADYEFTIEVVNGQMPDALPYVRYMDDSIYKSLGLSFFSMGKGENSSGAYTVGTALSESAANNVKRLIYQFLSYVNTYLIPKLVMVNWPDAMNYPVLKISGNHTANMASILNAYGQMISASLKEGGFDEQQYQTILANAPSVIREALGVDADKRREMVESRRQSIR